ncbi:MAG: PIN domain-containing protein [Dehalobacterium sp.]
MGLTRQNALFVALKNIFQIPAKIETVPVKTGTKNALDFQLACFLGRKAKGSSNEFFIVSKDKGFSVLESFLSPVKVNLIDPFTEAE